MEEKQVTAQVQEEQKKVEEPMRTRSIRATDDTFEKLKDMAISAGYENQGTALGALLELWATEQTRKENPGRATEIDNFETLLSSLGAAFNNALDINAGAEARIRKEFADRIAQTETANAALTDKIRQQVETIAGQAAELDQLRPAKVKISEMETENKTLKETNVRLQAELSELRAEYLAKYQDAFAQLTEATATKKVKRTKQDKAE